MRLFLKSYHKRVSVPLFQLGFPPTSFQYGGIAFGNGVYEGGIITNELGLSLFHGRGLCRFWSGSTVFGTYNYGHLEGIVTVHHSSFSKHISGGELFKFKPEMFSSSIETRQNNQLLSTVTRDLTYFDLINKVIDGSRNVLIEALCNVPSGDCMGNGFEVGNLVITDALSVGSFPFIESAAIRHTSTSMEGAYLIQDVMPHQLESAIDQRYAHPAVFIGGWKNHQIVYVLYRNTIYVCNRGDGAPVSTQRRGFCQSIVPITLPGSEIQSFLMALATIRTDRDGPEKLAAIWSEYIPKSYNVPAKIRGVYFEKRVQIIPNCWLYSSRVAAALVLGIYADKLGVHFETIYRQTLSTEAMIKRQLSARNPIRFGDFDPSITPDSKLGKLIKARLPHFKFS